MGAGEEDLGPALLAAHVIDIGAHAVAVPQRLARHDLVAADDRFGAAEIDHGVAVFDPLDDAVHDLADAVLVFLILLLALGVAHLLDDDLLGGLAGDAAVFEGRQGFGEEVADLGVGVALAGFRERDLGRRVLDLLGYFEKTGKRDLAGLAVDLGADFVLGAVARAGRLLDRLFHRFEDDLLVDGFLSGDRVGDLQKLKSVGAHCHGYALWFMPFRPSTFHP